MKRRDNAQHGKRRRVRRMGAERPWKKMNWTECEAQRDVRTTCVCFTRAGRDAAWNECTAETQLHKTQTLTGTISVAIAFVFAAFIHNVLASPYLSFAHTPYGFFNVKWDNIHAYIHTYSLTHSLSFFHPYSSFGLFTAMLCVFICN